MLKEFIQSELNKIWYFEDYYGTEQQIESEELILNETNIIEYKTIAWKNSYNKSQI